MACSMSPAICSCVATPLGTRLFRARVTRSRARTCYAGRNTTPRVVNVGRDPQSGLPADSLTPARAVGVSGMYFLSAPTERAGGSMISLWRWNSPFGSNTFVRKGSVQVSPYVQPPAALQLGGFPTGVTACSQTGAIASRRTTPAISPLTGPTTPCGERTRSAARRPGHRSRVCSGTSSEISTVGRRYCSTDRRRRESWTLPLLPDLAVDQAGNVALAYNFSSAPTILASVTRRSQPRPRSETVLKLASHSPGAALRDYAHGARSHDRLRSGISAVRQAACRHILRWDLAERHQDRSLTSTHSGRQSGRPMTRASRHGSPVLETETWPEKLLGALSLPTYRER